MKFELSAVFSRYNETVIFGSFPTNKATTTFCTIYCEILANSTQSCAEVIKPDNCNRPEGPLSSRFIWARSLPASSAIIRLFLQRQLLLKLLLTLLLCLLFLLLCLLLLASSWDSLPRACEVVDKEKLTVSAFKAFFLSRWFYFASLCLLFLLVAYNLRRFCCIFLLSHLWLLLFFSILNFLFVYYSI